MFLDRKLGIPPIPYCPRRVIRARTLLPSLRSSGQRDSGQPRNVSQAPGSAADRPVARFLSFLTNSRFAVTPEGNANSELDIVRWNKRVRKSQSSPIPREPASSPARRRFLHRCKSQAPQRVNRAGSGFGRPNRRLGSAPHRAGRRETQGRGKSHDELSRRFPPMPPAKARASKPPIAAA